MSSEKKIRLRFAPSPTGNLHIGSVRTALFNWVYAKHFGGELVLRIEDTDLKRSSKEFEANILEGLDWLGLEMTEGPNEGGDLGPYRQSERIHKQVYAEVCNQLLESGHAYHCFETPEELEAEQEAAKEAGIPYVYSRKSLAYSKEEVQEKLASGMAYTVRFKVPDNKDLVFMDDVRGEISFDSSLISDFVILKSDGSPAYNFAVVVDDMLMKITHVVRGEDHISNTPRQLMMYDALGVEAPVFAHLPIMLGPDRSKLSKRHGAKSVSEYRAEGYLKSALINYLSLLGWSPDSEEEIFSVSELISIFDPKRISKSGAVFDTEKLLWVNGQHIRQLSPTELYDHVWPFLSDHDQAILSQKERLLVDAMFVSIQDNIQLLTEVNHYIHVYTQEEEEVLSHIKSIVFNDTDKKVLQWLLESSDSETEWSIDSVTRLIENACEVLQLGKGKVFKPVRLATSGMKSGPNLTDYCYIIGKSTFQSRLENVLS